MNGDLVSLAEGDQGIATIVSPTLIRPRALLGVVPPRPDDRWRLGERGARLSTIAVAILVVSLVLHGALLVIALFGAKPAVPAQQEIPVEIVQAPPQLPPQVPPQVPPASPPPIRTAPPPPPAPAKAPDPDAEQRASLERELAALKAEQAALKAPDEGDGPLRGSTRALALPSVAADGEEIGYQALVFSQLAKAKEGLTSKGGAGTVGVRFAVDEEGRLADVAVAVTSGDARLDADAVAIVRRAAPFPKPPAGAERDFSANVAYAAPR